MRILLLAAAAGIAALAIPAASTAQSVSTQGNQRSHDSFGSFSNDDTRLRATAPSPTSTTTGGMTAPTAPSRAGCRTIRIARRTGCGGRDQDGIVNHSPSAFLSHNLR